MSLQMSIVLCSDEPDIACEALGQDIAHRFPELPPLSEMNQKDGIISFSLGGADVFLAPMPAPVPWSDLEGPCATSILWRDAASLLRDHKRHLIVTVSGELDPLALSTLLTQITTSAMAASATALGVFWTNAALLVPKNIFTEFAAEVLPLGPPLPIWVDFRVGKAGESTSSGFTTGMIELGHMEFEAQDAPESPSKLRERLEALAHYVIENGPVLQDGDTIGEDAAERIGVVYSGSAFGLAGTVISLKYEQNPKTKPWWKPWR